MKMINLLNGLLVLGCVMALQPGYAMEPLSDNELASVTGREGFNKERLLQDFADLQAKLVADANDGDGRISAETFIGQTQLIFGAMGISLDNIVVDGVQYNGTMTLDANGVKTTVAIPSYFKSIQIGAVRLGGGPSIGMVEIVGLNLHNVHVQVSFHK
ncbi:hypothetical protein QJS83_08720 [Bdellovibrio sp. 22V]|uniref:hypothetical protein n=1 Tax=Bdellovibrio TaxID=958 RepID=UPI002542B405|nr:hypothetical protein [Bdellovibrio sp. 22V]WII70539.1 hypothetical protein QJS83_08720 [Bdellovibrio sp. 22V]